MWYHNAYADSSLKLSTLAVGWMIRVLDSSRSRRFFSSPGYPNLLWHPPSFQFNGYQGFSMGLIWLGHEIGPLPPPTSAKIKNEWTIPLFHTCLHGLHRDNFTLLLFGNLVDSVHILQNFQPCQHCSHINVTSALYLLVS